MNKDRSGHQSDDDDEHIMATLRREIRHAYRTRDRTQHRLDLRVIIPDSELKRPVFHNKHAVETLEYLVQKNKGDISGHIPWVVDAMEILLQRTRGLTTRDSPTFTPLNTTSTTNTQSKSKSKSNK